MTDLLTNALLLAKGLYGYSAIYSCFSSCSKRRQIVHAALGCKRQKGSVGTCVELCPGL